MKKITVLLCVLLLSACSTTFVYKNVSWLVYWYLDDYVELNNQQEEQFDLMLANWIDWHKATELPKYEAHLAELIEDIKNKKIDRDRISYHREKARAHWVRARAHVAPDIVSLAKTLDQKQISYFFAQLEKENVEEEEENAEISSLSPEEQAKKWIKRNQKGAKRWIGKLNEEQKLHIAQFRDRFERTGLHWLEYRRSYQQALREVFDDNDRSDMFEENLMALILNPDIYKSDAFLEATEANNSASADYFIGLLALSEQKQIDRLIDEITEIKDDVVSLK